jgi:hypothetical protein
MLRRGLHPAFADRPAKAVLFDIVNSTQGRGPFAPERRTMPNDNALSFVGKIRTAYKAAQKAEGDALKYAIECGEQLILAKENVEATKGKWKSWCNDNIPEIPQTTENLYRRLASAVANDADIFADCKSIREAIKKLPKRERKQKEGDGDKPAKKNSNALLSGSASTDLATTFKNTAVDEVYSALTQAWDPEQLRDLVNRLLAYFKPADLNIPSGLRRPLNTPAQPSQ